MSTLYGREGGGGALRCARGEGGGAVCAMVGAGAARGRYETCPVSTRGGTRLVRLVRRGGGGGRGR